jgi:pilus assembly protein FimV
VIGKKEKYLLAAQKLIERGQLDKALGELAKVVQDDPKDTRTWLKMAELHAKRGANAEATEIYLRTGDLYTEQGFAQKAVAVYKNVLKLSPGTVPAHLKLGALFKQLGLLSDAVQQLELAAAALLRSDKSVDAVAALRQAVETQPENIVLRVKLAETASQAGLIDEAVREFGKAADQLKTEGRTDESLRVVERLLFHQPDNYTKARELAETYIARGSPRPALSKLQACLKGDPRDPRTLLLLAKALEQLGQVEKAVSVLKELVRLCEDLGRPTERDAAIVRGLTLDPTDHELRAVAARYQLRGAAGAGGEATPAPVEIGDKAAGGGGSFDLSGVVLRPTGTTSGRVLAPVGPAESGVRSLSVGISLSAGPDVSRILAEADVFVKYGLLERAVDHLNRVFELDAENREAREKLIAVLQRLGRKADAARHIEMLTLQGSRTSLDEAQKLTESARIFEPDVELAGAAFEAAPGSSQDWSAGITLDTDDDPAAAVLTPTPEHGPPVFEEVIPAIPTDFDEEVHTGDMLFDADVDAVVDLDVVDLDVDAGALLDDTETGQAMPTVTGPAADGDEQTPQPRLQQVSPLVPSSRPSLDVDADEDRGIDSADAFRRDLPSASSRGTEPLPTAPPQGAVNEDDEEVSAEMDQVNFFVEQSLPDEAHALLQDLEARFPRHPGVAAKLREVQAQTRTRTRTKGLGGLAFEEGDFSEAAQRRRSGATTIEAPPRAEEPKGPPRAVIIGGESSDPSTHADLAVAYKEMGLFDAAIGELKLLAEDPDREVFALTTMGECFEAKGSFTDAILRYKRALNCSQVNPAETLVLYFLLGAAFEHLGDISEALYFFEKVAKREPKFRAVDEKVAELKPQMVKRAR